MKTRVIVVPVVTAPDGRILLCRMAPNRGVFPGQWALPGGGVEPGERIEEALRREVREELGLEVSSLAPLLFKDAVLEKTFEGGAKEQLHMIFLVYRCSSGSLSIRLNQEFSEFTWASAADLGTLELNALTRETLTSAGFISAGERGAG